ncbi:HigA family addiction module antidote protein [bacterium]|nr:HigA family addiction module antidote protein [bacterium]MBR4530863.1 HigA family addiction module antidote protein [bacterium]
MSESRITTDNKLANIHPGEVLKEEFLVPMNISAYRLAKEINIPQTRISEIIHGKRSITADTAIRFSKFFGTTAEFWLNLQNLYDLEEEEKNHASEFESIKMYVYA